MGGERVLASGRYPERKELADWTGLAAEAPSIYYRDGERAGSHWGGNCRQVRAMPEIHHYHEAQKLGLSKADMAQATEMAKKVKGSPHQAILRLVHRLTGSNVRVGCRSGPQIGIGAWWFDTDNYT